jgi:hypothetical protein
LQAPQAEAAALLARIPGDAGRELRYALAHAKALAALPAHAAAGALAALACLVRCHGGVSAAAGRVRRRAGGARG